jgi:Caspase domain
VGRRLALLVATYEYQDTGLRRLTSPAHDAEALAAVLKDTAIADFEVTTLVNASRHRIGEAISGLYRDRKRDDLTLLYFTGHGLKDDDGRLYLATGDTLLDSLLFTSLPAEQVDQAMSAASSHRQVLILDCCYGGAFPAGGAKGDTGVHSLERFQGRGRTVLTASDATQYAFEGGGRVSGRAEPSVFTRHLVRGLRDGTADLDGDGDITLDELYTYVHDRVIEERPGQRPKRLDNVDGRIFIARNIHWAMPANLRRTIGSPLPEDRIAVLHDLIRLYQIGNAYVRSQVLEAMSQLAVDPDTEVAAAAFHRLRQLMPGVDPPRRRAATGPEPPDRHPPGTRQPSPALSAPTGEPSGSEPEFPQPHQRPRHDERPAQASPRVRYRAQALPRRGARHSLSDRARRWIWIAIILIVVAPSPAFLFLLPSSGGGRGTGTATGKPTATTTGRPMATATATGKPTTATPTLQVSAALDEIQLARQIGFVAYGAWAATGVPQHGCGIDSVAPGSVAAQLGVVHGDSVVVLGELSITDCDSMINYLFSYHSYGGGPLIVSYGQNGSYANGQITVPGVTS